LPHPRVPAAAFPASQAPLDGALMHIHI